MEIEKDRTWLQCTNCGCMHIVERNIPMSRSIVNSYCTQCGNGRALNCGYNEDDAEMLKDYFLDARYF